VQRFATKAQARTRVAAWIDEYNRDRKHSSNGMRSPINYEIALRGGEPDSSAAA
jgi:transposase InsO family protein